MKINIKKGFDFVDQTVKELWFVAKIKEELILLSFTVLRETTKYYVACEQKFIGSEYESHFKKWVPKQGESRIAWPTKREAIECFIKQKENEMKSYYRRTQAIQSLILKANVLEKEEG